MISNDVTSAYQAGRRDALDEAAAFALSSAREFNGFAIRAAIGDAAAAGFAKIWESVAEHVASLKADAA